MGAKPAEVARDQAGHGGIGKRRVGDGSALNRGHGGVGIAGSIAVAVAGVADIEGVAVAAGVEIDVALDRAAIVDGGAAVQCR